MYHLNKWVNINGLIPLVPSLLTFNHVAGLLIQVRKKGKGNIKYQ